jgi:hypothetical protein
MNLYGPRERNQVDGMSNLAKAIKHDLERMRLAELEVRMRQHHSRRDLQCATCGYLLCGCAVPAPNPQAKHNEN